jgi:hypothetical protein
LAAELAFARPQARKQFQPMPSFAQENNYSLDHFFIYPAGNLQPSS